MGLFQCEIYSEELKKNTTFIVVTPDRPALGKQENTKRDYAVKYLLHKVGGNCRSWLREAPLERISSEKQVVFVLPDGSGSAFKNIEGVGNYETYIKKELPKIVNRYFGVSGEGEICYGIDSL